jgi:hypothetical protein
MMSKEYVSVNDFHYKGYNIDGVGDGDSFCYCPCDIDGTPKLFYGDCHFSCGSEAFDYILNSFNCHNPYTYFDDDEVNNIIEDMWLSSCGRGRLFFGKYLVVDDGHLPTKEYVKDAIDWLNGNPRNYAIAYNTNNGVEEINCMEFLNGNLEGENDKPIKMDVPKEIQDLYSEIISRREYANNKFPKNMTRAEYYSLIRQENKEHKSMKKLIRLTEQDLHRIVKESVNRIITERSYEFYKDAQNAAMKQGRNDLASKFKNAAMNSWNRQYGHGVKPRYGNEGDGSYPEFDETNPYFAMTDSELGSSTIEAGDGSGYGGYSHYSEIGDTAYPERNYFFTPNSNNPQRGELKRARNARDFNGLWHSNGGRNAIYNKGLDRIRK